MRKNNDYISDAEDSAERIPYEEALANEGMKSIAECMFSSIVPACCSHGCMVETDGECEHGYPSVHMDAGII